jgi:hypothetical protein
MHRLIVMFLFSLALAQADTLVLRNGSSVAGSWIGGDAQTVRFLVGEEVQRFRKSDIKQVVFGSDQPAPPPNRVSPPSPPAAFEQIAEGIRFRLQACERHATDSVVCMLSIESPSKDVQVELTSYGSFIVDSHGIQQHPQMMTLGASSGSHDANTLVVQSVPVRSEVKFPGVDPGVDRIPVFTLEYNAGTGRHTVTYRNVPLQGN